MDKLKIFENEINSIETPILKEFAKYALTKIPEYFFHIPASSSGKYHPDFSTTTHGLIQHTKFALAIANELLALEYYHTTVIFKNPIVRDAIRISLLFHDSYKSGEQKDYAWSKYTQHEHPLRAAEAMLDIYIEWLEEPGVIDQIKFEGDVFIEMVQNYISCHMGQWNTSNKSPFILPKPLTEGERFVHTCDYLSSRKIFNGCHLNRLCHNSSTEQVCLIFSDAAFTRVSCDNCEKRKNYSK